MKTDPNSPASAQRLSYPYPEWNPARSFNGLTVLELFAAMAMQGLLSAYANPHSKPIIDANEIARDSVRQADALIAALNEEAK